MKTITATVPAWMSENHDMDALNRSPERAVSEPCYTPTDMTSAGWTRIGTATITLELVGTDELVQNQIGTLEKQMQAVMVDAQQKCNYIKDRISKLQALCFDAEAA